MIKFALIFCAFLLSVTTFAQSPVQLWLAEYNQPSPTNDTALVIKIDGARNQYVTGVTGGDITTIKYDTTGGELWKVVYNGAGNGYDRPYAMVLDAAGNVYITGSTYGTSRSGDFLTIKYSTGGVLQWAATYNGPATRIDRASAIAVDTADNVYVTGFSQDAAGKKDYTTVKYDQSGAQQWIMNYNAAANGDDEAVGIAVDPSGNAYVTGTVTAASSNTDVTTIKYNSAGAQQWAKTYDDVTNNDDEAVTIKTDAPGNTIYVCVKNIDKCGVLVYNAAGTQQWEAAYTPVGYGSDPRDMAVDAAGNVYVGGTYNNSSSSGLIVKFNFVGGFQWYASYTSASANAYDYFVSIAVDSLGNVYGGGFSNDYPYVYYLAAKFNSSGVQQWAQNSTAKGIGNDIALDIAGNLFITGGMTNNPLDSKAFGTVKYDPNGVELDTMAYSGSGNGIAHPADMATDKAGNIYVTGFATAVNGRTDCATVKYDKNGVQQWAVTYNGTGNNDDEAKGIALDTFGNVYVTGFATDTSGRETYVTIKYNNNGVQQWLVLYDGVAGRDDEAADIAVDAAGNNVYVTGSAYVRSADADIVTIRYSGAGVQLWTSIYNDPSNLNDVARVVRVDAAGNVYAGGSSVIKYVSSGTEQWSSPASINALEVDTFGNVHIAGASYQGAGDYDFYALMYNSTGVQQWYTKYNSGGTNVDRAYDLAIDVAGNTYATGTTREFGPNPSRCTTIKYNLSGTQQWMANYNGGTSNTVNSGQKIVVDANGNSYLACRSINNNSGVSSSDYTVLKYDGGGTQQWVVNYNGTGDFTDQPLTLALDNSGNVIVTGYSAVNGGESFVTLKYASNPLTAGSVNSSLCAGEAVNVPYGSSLTFNSDNVFTAQLSDAFGSFSNAVDIGMDTTGSGNISAVIPVNTIAGSAYRIRVISSSPAYTGNNNGANITINSIKVPSVTITADPDTVICAGAEVTFTAQATNGGASPSYQWKKNGVPIGTNSDVYTDSALVSGDVISCKLTSNANCVSPADASDTVTITVNTPSSVSVNLSICQGDSYLFNNQNLIAAGTYYDTLTNAAGCDSLITLTLSVKNVVTGLLSARICNGESYSFNGQNLTTNGTYYDTLVAANSCDSIITLTLTVNQPSDTTLNHTICAGTSFFFNNQNLTSAGTYYDTLTNAAGCDSLVTLHLSVNSFATNSLSESICNGESYSFNGQNLTTNGTYYDTLVAANSCDSIITLTLTVNQPNGTTLNHTICAGTSFFFNNQNLTSAGTYYDTLINAASCDSLVTLHLSVNNFTASTLNAHICAGGSYFFNGQNLTTSGAYYDTLLASSGCDSIVTLNLTVNQPNGATLNHTICAGTSFFFNNQNLTSAGTYYGTLINAASCDSLVTLHLSVNNFTSSTLNAHICAGGSYLFNGQNLTTSGAYYDTLLASSGCDSIVTLNLTVNQPNGATLNHTICAGTSFFFNNQNLTLAGTYYDTLINAASCDSLVTLHLSVNNFTSSTLNAHICAGGSYFFNGQNLTTSGAYYDTLLAASGCDSIVTLNLTVNQPNGATLNHTICAGTSFFFNNQNLTSAGTYHDTLTNAAGCDSSVTLNLFVNNVLGNTTSASICNGGSYFFNGQNLTIGGAYKDTLLSSSGCDSIVTLLLTVNQANRTTLNNTICTGASFFFNNQNLTTAGTYHDTLTNATGCDSLVTLNLSVNSFVINAVTASICSGESYLFNGQNLTATGNYNDTLMASSGCDSIVTLNLTVNQPSGIVLNDTICSGTSFFFNNQNIASAGIYYDTLMNVGGCDSLVTLNLRVNQPDSIVLNDTICAGAFFFFNNQNLASPGIYYDTLTNLAGCDSLVMLNLSVSNVVTSVLNENICAGESFSFNGQNLTAGGTYTDTLLASGGCDSVVTLNLSVGQPSNTALDNTICAGTSFFFNNQTLTSSGTYFDTLTNTTGCDSLVTLNLSIDSFVTSVLSAGICAGDSYSFNGQSLTTSGVYTDTLSASGGCDSIITLNLTVNPTESVVLNDTICAGTSLFFNNQSLAAAGTYFDTLMNITGCDSLVMLNLTVDSSATSSFDITICDGEGYFFNAQNLTESGTYTDTFNRATGCDSIVTLHLTVNPATHTTFTQSICDGDIYLFDGDTLTASGVYHDTLPVPTGCYNVITLTLDVNPLPQPAITQTGDTLFTGGYVIYQWLLNGDTIINANANQLLVTQNGAYTVIATDSGGCSGFSASMNVTGVEINGLRDYAVKLYPNPNTGSFMLEFSDDASKEIMITDVLGRVMVAGTQVQGRKQFNIVETAGVYFLRIRQGNQVRNLKFTVLKP